MSGSPTIASLFAQRVVVGVGDLAVSNNNSTVLSTYALGSCICVIAYDPGNGWSYFPSVGETLLTTGFVAFEVLAYVYLIKRFPIPIEKDGRPHHAFEGASRSIDSSTRWGVIPFRHR